MAERVRASFPSMVLSPVTKERVAHAIFRQGLFCPMPYQGYGHVGHRPASPTWPYTWYGMGLAEYGVGDSQVSFVTGLKTMLGKDALTRSAMAFAKSAEVDPGFVRGLVELANTALRQRVNIKLGVALDALRRAATTPVGQDPQVLLARGRVEREVGDGDSALAAFQRLPATGREPEPGAARGRAHAASCSAASTASAPYYEGAAIRRFGDRGGISRRPRDDRLRQRAPRVRPDGRRAAGGLPAGSSGPTGTRPELRADGERLREHYRRLFYARKNFQLTSLNRHYDIVERYRSGSRDFDDRGVIYIRHGEPTSRATYAAPGSSPTSRGATAGPTAT